MRLSVGGSILSLLPLTSNANQSNKYERYDYGCHLFMEHDLAGLKSLTYVRLHSTSAINCAFAPSLS
jgi:hypothetical protein